jgi:2-iminobutanoate/2-iminopropanoate deaminase
VSPTVAIASQNVPTFTLGGEAVHGSQAMLVHCGDVSLLYTSGQVAPAAPDGRGDITSQVHAVLKQVRELVRAAGGDMRDVVKLTAWARTREDIASYARIRKNYFPHAPASTSVLADLVEPDILIEVEAIAAIHESSRQSSGHTPEVFDHHEGGQ